MTKGLDEKEAMDTIGITINDIYRYIEDTKAKLEAYKNKG